MKITRAPDFAPIALTPAASNPIAARYFISASSPPPILASRSTPAFQSFNAQGTHPYREWNKKGVKKKDGAVEWIRTTTVLLPPAPQAGASASSATTAPSQS